MFSPFPIGIFSSVSATVEPEFTGYNPDYLYGTVSQWEPVEPQGVVGDLLTFSIQSGSLPVGLSLDPYTGIITGTPTAVGVNPCVIRCENTLGFVDQPCTFSLLLDDHVEFYADEWGVGSEFAWTIPNGFKSLAENKLLRMYLASGGGGGAASARGSVGDGNYGLAGGGGGSGRYFSLLYGWAGDLLPGKSIAIYLGAGGLGGTTNGAVGTSGEMSYVFIEDLYSVEVTGGGGGINITGSETTTFLGEATGTGGLAGGGNRAMNGFNAINGWYDPGGGSSWDLSAMGGGGAYGMSNDRWDFESSWSIGSSLRPPSLNWGEAIASSSLGVTKRFAVNTFGYDFALKRGQGGGGGGIANSTNTDFGDAYARFGFVDPITPQETYYAEYGKGGDGSPGYLAFRWGPHSAIDSWF